MLYTIKLNKNKDFLRLYSKGTFVSCSMCSVYYRRNGKKNNRIGISTGKKIGNAVDRSRARRIIRQAYREKEMEFPVGYDIVVCARKSIKGCKTYNIKKFFSSRVIPAMKNPAKETKGKKTENDSSG